MTIRTIAWLKNNWAERDPYDWMYDMLDTLAAAGGVSDVTAVAYGDADGATALVTVPANSIINRVYVIRTTAWDAVTAFEIGKAGDTDWLVNTTQANVTGAIGSGEEAEAEVINCNKFVETATAVNINYTAGAASAGAGYVVVEYKTIA